jgi:hypothetical protein
MTCSIVCSEDSNLCATMFFRYEGVNTNINDLLALGTKKGNPVHGAVDSVYKFPDLWNAPGGNYIQSMSGCFTIRPQFQVPSVNDSQHMMSLRVL